MTAIRDLAGAALTAVLAVIAVLFALPEAKALQCSDERFEGSGYVVCTIDPAVSDLRLFWKNEEGQPYRRFSSLASALREQEQNLIFAINAGMYQADFAPLGLYIENGAELHPADTATIEGPPRQVPNFYKKPNGVFFSGEDGAGILPTEDFLAAKPDVQLATQSGPMLVIENVLHPALIPGSTDTTRRSGVGICEGGLIRFAISDWRVNFHEFARFFRDQLACPNALFLDGGRGAGLFLPEKRRNDFSWHGGYGPILGVVE